MIINSNYFIWVSCLSHIVTKGGVAYSRIEIVEEKVSTSQCMWSPQWEFEHDSKTNNHGHQEVTVLSCQVYRGLQTLLIN